MSPSSSRSQGKHTAPSLLTVAEVARSMQVSTMTVYRLIKSGRLAAVRVGRNYRVRRKDLEDFLDSNKVHPEEQG